MGLENSPMYGIITQMPGLNELVEKEARPLYFGDEQEFVYGGCIEEVTPEGEITELTILFHGRDSAFGLTVEQADHEELRTLGESEDDLPPAIETEHVDPQIVVNVLRLPTSKILELAVRTDEVTEI